MIDLIVCIIFLWLAAKTIKLMFKITWGLAKVAAVILFLCALPALVLSLLMASGFILLIPLVLVGTAFSILRVCL